MRKKLTHSRVATEEQEQARLVRWADLARLPASVTMSVGAKGKIGDWLMHIPNGGHRAGKITRKKKTISIIGAKLKRQGVRKGVPDLLFAIPLFGWAGLWIEMKRRRGGSVSADQRDWINRLRAVGYKVVVAKGADEAQAAIERYLSGEVSREDMD